MVKAQSLLYAIYICLVVAVLCGSLLYLSSLYDRLNLFYNSREQLYIHNQSLVNYATANFKEKINSLPEEDGTGTGGIYEIKQYGLLSLITASSFVGNDTVTSVHFAGSTSFYKDAALYITNFGRPLCYSGTVAIKGKKYLPKPYLNGIHIDNKLNDLISDKSIVISGVNLPEPNKRIHEINNLLNAESATFNEIEKHDSLYYNSFLKPTKKIEIVNRVLADINIKGNLILYSNDSLYISSSCRLEDVIVMAPKITFESFFEGTIQAFANKRIVVNKNVKLKYPSVLMVNNPTSADSEIRIMEESKIFGAIVLIGNSTEKIRHNTIVIEEKSRIDADIYCTGNLICSSDVHGFVFTNLLSYKTKSSIYENCIAEIEIDPQKRPEYLVSIPILEPKKYETLKKLF